MKQLARTFNYSVFSIPFFIFILVVKLPLSANEQDKNLIIRQKKVNTVLKHRIFLIESLKTSLVLCQFIR